MYKICVYVPHGLFKAAGPIMNFQALGFIEEPSNNDRFTNRLQFSIKLTTLSLVTDYTRNFFY